MTAQREQNQQLLKDAYKALADKKGNTWANNAVMLFKIKVFNNVLMQKDLNDDAKLLAQIIGTWATDAMPKTEQRHEMMADVAEIVALFGLESASDAERWMQ